jgi:hypothetical protein
MKGHLPSLLVVVGATATLAWTCLEHVGKSPARPTNPQTMEEVAAIARDRGLHYRSDRKNGTFGLRLIISETPLTWERVALFGLTPGSEAAWNGTVAVLRNWQICFLPTPNEQTQVWGKFVLYGDPALIQRLMAADARQP